jgi:hypothetical protein
MSKFELYFNLGISHITDFQGFDHMLFLLALCTTYQFADWRKWLLAVTLFTVGHSATLFISGMNYLEVSAEWIEFLIPVTIFISGLLNLRKPAKNKGGYIRPILAGVFGLIHGFGFSNYFKMVFADETSPFSAVGYFTIGIEAGQLLIVLGIFIISWALVQGLKVKQRDWELFVTGGVVALSLFLMTETFPTQIF